MFANPYDLVNAIQTERLQTAERERLASAMRRAKRANGDRTAVGHLMTSLGAAGRLVSRSFLRSSRAARPRTAG